MYALFYFPQIFNLFFLPSSNNYAILISTIGPFYTAKLIQTTVCSCHVTYAFESESTLYSCLNVKELLARSRREI